jgi:hypothetical protein
MRFPLRVSYGDGSAVEVITSAADSIRFEEKYDRSITKLDTEGRYTDVVWLAWAALTRTKKVTTEFDTWIDTVDEVSVGAGTADVPPLEITPRIG